MKIKIIITTFLLLLFFSCGTIPYHTAEKQFDYSEVYGDNPFSNGIVFYGDSRKDHRVHIKIVENILSFDPSAVFHLGDAVSEGENKQQWKAFDTVTEVLRSSADFYPVIGNHEKGVEPQWYFNHWKADIGQGYYSLDLAVNGDLLIPSVTNQKDSSQTAVRIIVLHSNPGFLEENEEQHKWLINELDKYRELPVVLVFHIPLYCAGVHYEEMDKKTRNRGISFLPAQGTGLVACPDPVCPQLFWVVNPLILRFWLWRFHSPDLL